MVITADGQRMYVAAFGSNKIARFAVDALENDSFVPSAANHIALSGGGPTGLVLKEASNQLLVLTRFDNAIALLNESSGAEITKLRLFNPEPATLLAGRPFLYDAQLTRAAATRRAPRATCLVTWAVWRGTWAIPT